MKTNAQLHVACIVQVATRTQLQPAILHAASEGFSFAKLIARPDIAKYGATKLLLKTTTYQIPWAVTLFDEIVSALASHILGGDKASELLKCEIPIRSLLVQFSTLADSQTLQAAL